MTLNEVKKKVAESNNLEWFKGRRLNINYTHINYKISLDGIVAIYDFVLRQVKGFDAFNSLPDDLKSVRNRFNQVKNKIIEYVSNDTKNDYDWNNTINQVSANNIIIFPSDAPETEFLVKLSQNDSEYYVGAYEFLSGSTSYPTQKNKLIGYLMAYEFVTKDSSKIVERKDVEKKSISRIRTEFQEQLAGSENHLTNYLAEANQKVITYSTTLDDFKKEKEKSYKEWFQNTSTEFASFREASNSKVTELENLYKEKLKLEAPAKYWNDRATLLRREGKNWLMWLITSIAVAVFVLLLVLLLTENGTLDKIFQNTGTAIKWSVILITLISFLAFAIRIFSKLTFSAFHLVRDAEEREQLTYVYLALQKEKGIDETERHLIMQSLFSRADSGLLKDDSGPTMPGIVDKIMAK